MVTRVDVHLQSRDVIVHWLSLLLDVSTLSVVIVIIAMCVYSQYVYEKQKVVFWNTTQISSKVSSRIRRQAKRFKEIGSVKNRKVNCWRHVHTEETLDEIGERLEHTPQKSLKRLSQETGISVSSVQRATKLRKLHIRIVNIHTFTQWEFLSRHVTNCNNHNHYTYSTNV